MLVAVWVTLAIVLLVLAGGGFHVVREGLRTWRAVRRLTRVLGAGGDAVTSRVEAATAKLDGAGAAAERLTDATARLQRSLAYARVVADAAGDARATVTRLRGSVPRK